MTHTTTAALEYLRPTPERPYTYMYPPPDGQPWQNAGYHRVPVTIRDARADTHLSLDREGYQLRHAPSVFDHLLRKRMPGTPQAFGRIEGQRPGAAGRVHCDFTPASAQRRMELELRGDTARVQRYSIVNLWRAIRHPVLDAPLAVCDARSATPADLVASDIFYPERHGEIYQAVHNTAHAWSYFPAMTRDEVLLFKQFDSAPGPVARCTPHAAFEHADAPADATPRESNEIRCLLIYRGDEK